ncbi:SPASM domain-containing protein [Pseudomonas luteola]
MSLQKYQESLGFIYNLWEKLGINVSHLTIEYVGGELLLLSESEINSCVTMARNFFDERGIVVRDGAQSNLIGSSRRIDNLFSIFDGRVGTSIDSFSDKRKFKGSATKYKTFFLHNESQLASGKLTPAVYTFDADTIDNALLEIDKAINDGRNLMVRPVFGGGMAVKMPDPERVANLYVAALERWWMKSDIRLEPFYSLARKRVSSRLGVYSRENMDYCSFQSNCTVRSMSLEPSGDLYLCQDMADAGKSPIGNALRNFFDMQTWSNLNLRPARLDMSCYSCAYFKECQGGCLLKSLESGNGMYGKSDHCEAWKLMFRKIDDLVDESMEGSLIKWLDRIEAKE